MLGWCTTARFLHGLQRNILYVTKMPLFLTRGQCWLAGRNLPFDTVRHWGYLGTLQVKVVGIASGWCLDCQKQSLIEQVPRKVHGTSAYYVHLYVLDVTFHSTVRSHSAVWFLQHLKLRGSSAYCICRPLVSQSRGCTERSLWAFVL